MVLALVFVVAGLVSNLIPGTWDLSAITDGAGFVVIALGMVLSELGLKQNGRISSVWIIVIIVASLAALVVAGIQVLNDYRDVASVVISIVMAAAVITTSAFVISGNRAGRLGTDRQPRRRP